MKILVAIKQVPARDSQLRIASLGRWIAEDDLAYEINEPDAYALEEGLQLKEKHGGEVVALCLGPSRAASTIREALAKGADRAIVTRNAPYALHVGDQRAQAERTFQPYHVFVVVLGDEPVEGPARGSAPALIEVVEAVAAAQAIETRPCGWRGDARTAVQHQHVPSRAVGKMVQRDARLHLPGFARHLRRTECA